MQPISDAVSGPLFPLADEHAELRRFLDAENDDQVAQLIQTLDFMMSLVSPDDGYRALHCIAALLKSTKKSTFETFILDLQNPEKLKSALIRLMQPNSYE